MAPRGEPRSARPGNAVIALRTVAALLTLAASCTRPATPLAPEVHPSPPAAPSTSGASAAGEPPPPLLPSAQASLSPTAPPEVAPPRISAAEARTLLFLPDGPASPPCAEASDGETVRCLLRVRYAADPPAAAIATSLYDATGDVAGLSPAETMNGGFRGTLHLVPELPTGPRRKHLAWVATAADDHDDFFRRLAKVAAGAPSSPPYRHRGIGFRFLRSVGRTTPSAYATGWSIAYNVDGSLNTSADAVRELLFHEMFHLNDEAHGDWSPRALGPTFDAIAARCRGDVACLTPFAPTETRVRGGTYYAFQPNNGEAVREYAAELALRYYRESRRALRGETATGRGAARFKCGPAENRAAWRLLVEEFFDGRDATGDCP